MVIRRQQLELLSCRVTWRKGFKVYHIIHKVDILYGMSGDCVFLTNMKDGRVFYLHLVSQSLFGRNINMCSAQYKFKLS